MPCFMKKNMFLFKVLLRFSPRKWFLVDFCHARIAGAFQLKSFIQIRKCESLTSKVEVALLYPLALWYNQNNVRAVPA